MSQPVRPLPVVDDLTRPFWEAARNGHLAIQRCSDCGYYNHPPRRECDRCLSWSLAFEEVSGKGTVWTFTVNYQPTMPGFELPHLVALIELDEQAMLLLPSDMPGLAPEDVRIGQRVSVRFEPLNDEISLPQFVLEGAGA